MLEEKYMERAIELAQMARGFTNPNPMVGAVIVKNGRIIGEGFHEKCGGLHAERNAFASLTESAEGATLYVTLEPCCHYGKTPPCTEAILENKIGKVVIGSRDPNPLVSGKGVRILKEQGIEVVEDFMKEKCDEINPVFFNYIKTKMPYVVMKYAMTADGKIATRTGESQWITGEKARELVARMRHNYMGIMVGIGTVLADDPLLNVRVQGLKSPTRIICDSRLLIPMDSQIVKTAGEFKTIVACADRNEEKIKVLEEKGITVLVLPDDSPGFEKKVDLKKLFEYLGENGTDSVLVEGGATLNDSVIKTGLVKRLEVFIAPKIFGGSIAKSPVGGRGFEHIKDAKSFTLKSVRQIDDDILLTYVTD